MTVHRTISLKSLGQIATQFGTWLNSRIEQERDACAIILLIGILVRLPFVVTNTIILWPDSLVYYRTALAALANHNLSVHQLYHTPVYPLFLASFLWLGKTATVGALIVFVQHIIGLASVCLFYSFCKRMASPVVAFWTCLLFVMHPLLIYYECVIQTEIFFLFFCCLVLCALSAVLQKGTWKTFLLLGFCAALFTLTRSVAQLYIICLALFVLIRWKKIDKALVGVCAMLIAFGLTVLPWIMVNGRTYGFWSITKGTGINLFLRVVDVDGKAPVKDTKYPDVKEAYERLSARYKGEKKVYFLVYNELKARYGYTFAKADESMEGLALEIIRQEPVEYIFNSAKLFFALLYRPKDNMMFCPLDGLSYFVCKNPRKSFFGTAGKVFGVSHTDPSPWLLGLIAFYLKHFYLSTKLIFALACFGLVSFALNVNKKREMHGEVILLAVVTICYFTAISVLFNPPEDRHRLVIDPLIFMLAVNGLIEFLRVCKAVFKRNVA